MKSLIQKTECEIKIMENTKHDLTSKLSSLYQRFNQVPYYLHSVLIHEGQDNSGHYYVYIKSPGNKTYTKFSDKIVVTSVTQEEMFNDALGDFGNRSAFCLFYVSEKEWKLMNQNGIETRI